MRVLRVEEWLSLCEEVLLFFDCMRMKTKFVLTYLEVKDVVGADGFAPVLVELLHVDCDRHSLEFLCPQLHASLSVVTPGHSI